VEVNYGGLVVNKNFLAKTT